MYVKVGSRYTLSIVVKDKVSGRAISSDTPLGTIYNRETNKYFNGVFWSEDKTEISASYISDGIYAISFIPNEVSVYEISLISKSYNISKSESIRSYSDKIERYIWPVGVSYNIIHTKNDVSDSLVSLTIQRKTDNMFYDGFNWQADEFEINMPSVESSTHMYQFLPLEETEYLVRVFEKAERVNSFAFESFIIDTTSSDSGPDNSPRSIGSSTIKSQDGTDTILLAPNGTPISNVKVTCFNLNGEEVNTAFTNSHGEWKMMVSTGDYIFIFEKDGFVSISLQRKVM
ncbi:MAG: carboxypeptidase-like regulatory domain-containing protein [Paraclostridium sp.]